MTFFCENVEGGPTEPLEVTCTQRMLKTWTILTHSSPECPPQESCMALAAGKALFPIMVSGRAVMSQVICRLDPLLLGGCSQTSHCEGNEGILVTH